MMKKYKISKELMNDIDRWNNSLDGWVWRDDVDSPLPFEVQMWWVDETRTTIERNNRLIALIQYVNGEDVFEIEKPKKWVVRSKNVDLGSYSYLTLYDRSGNRLREYSTKAHSMLINDDKYDATKFPSKEEANRWTNPLVEVVEVDDED